MRLIVFLNGHCKSGTGSACSGCRPWSGFKMMLIRPDSGPDPQHCFVKQIITLKQIVALPASVTSWHSCWLGSGSMVCLDPYPDQDSQSGSGSRRAKKLKKLINLIFLNTGCSLLRTEGFSCSLDVLYGVLGITKLKLLTKKEEEKLSAVFFPFSHQKPGSGLDPDPYPDPDSPKMLDPYPDADSKINLDPQLWWLLVSIEYSVFAVKYLCVRRRHTSGCFGRATAGEQRNQTGFWWWWKWRGQPAGILRDWTQRRPNWRLHRSAATMQNLPRPVLNEGLCRAQTLPSDPLPGAEETAVLLPVRAGFQGRVDNKKTDPKKPIQKNQPKKIPKKTI